MKSFIASPWVLSVLIAGGASSASAYTYQPVRCNTDSVEQGDAAKRNAWFKKCNKREYVRIFTGGDETKFGAVQAPRTLYVTFGVVDENTGNYSFPGNWIAPKDPNADCTVPAGYEPIGVCTSGCFMPSTKLSFDEEMSILKAKFTSVENVSTLHPDSTLESIEYENSPIAHYTADVRDELQEILSFEYSRPSGEKKALQVTTGHPLVDITGKVREAKDFKAGEFLISSNGKPMQIESIKGISYYGKVYNLWINRKTDAENLVVAEGVLAGTMYHQAGMGSSKMNQQIIRSKIPNSLLE